MCQEARPPKGTTDVFWRSSRASDQSQANAYAMIRRRAAAAGIATKLGNHSFRATGITAYLKNGGTLEKAAAMANHASTRTTQLYDRRRDEVSLDEAERIVI
jgi:integrase